METRSGTRRGKYVFKVFLGALKYKSSKKSGFQLSFYYLTHLFKAMRSELDRMTAFMCG